MLSGRTIKERARELGFDLAGIAPLNVWKDLEFSRQWVETGYNGEMRYLENPRRFDPLLVLPSAKSVVCVGLVYNAPLPYSTEVEENRSQELESRRQKAESRSQEGPETSRAEPGSVPAPVRSSEPETDTRNGQRTTDNGPFSNFHFPFSDPAPRAWISRYAWGRDYHETIRAKLEQLRAAIKESAPEVETRAFVDTGPVVERAFARFSGIGWMGKNTCIINQEKGSWLFLGVILCSLELAPDLPAPDRCGSCTACLEACPTGALVEPYAMDASRCISYLTIELRGTVPNEFRAKMGSNVFGCDICQDVCPWNKSYQPSALSSQQTSYQHARPLHTGEVMRPATTTIPEFHPMIVEASHFTIAERKIREQQARDNGQRTTNNGPRTTDSAGFSLFNPPLEALASITEEGFRLNFAHSPIKRAKYRGWLRNLAVAMGNSGDVRFAPWLERMARHPNPIVREHAAWALDRLRGEP
ncbi:MAG: tRNA epoxyqueuosine(34) reductase QueG [Terriglobia bacterium]|jgi:epoxyqueuosine reductase